MIDAKKITNFKLNDAELEEHILFWVCAAGKNGVTAAKCLHNFLEYGMQIMGAPATETPFGIVRFLDVRSRLEFALKYKGIGCYNQKARTMRELAASGMNLRTCSVEDLESIVGIGPKTSRCFIMHSRPNQRYAGLDTHVLKYLRDRGHVVPKSTPTGKKYRELEKIFLNYADEAGKPVAEFDLSIWNQYRSLSKTA